MRVRDEPSRRGERRRSDDLRELTALLAAAYLRLLEKRARKAAR